MFGSNENVAAIRRWVADLAKAVPVDHRSGFCIVLTRPLMVVASGGGI
jgi:hypothetical protein